MRGKLISFLMILLLLPSAFAAGLTVDYEVDALSECYRQRKVANPSVSLSGWQQKAL